VYTPVFVAGTMGSGTTLILISLANAFDCAGAVMESAMHISAKSFLRVRNVNTFSSIRQYQNAILPDPKWSVAKGRESLLNLYRSVCDGPREIVLDKGPNTNLVRAQFLAKCFPECKFLLIFRDPVDNIAGFRRKWQTFGKDSLEENIRFYKELHENFLEFYRTLPTRTIVVEYERFVLENEKMIKSVGSILDLKTRKEKINMIIPEYLISDSSAKIEIMNKAKTMARNQLSIEAAKQIQKELEPTYSKLRAAAI
jgi:hypothetical protein